MPEPETETETETETKRGIESKAETRRGIESKAATKRKTKAKGAENEWDKDQLGEWLRENYQEKDRSTRPTFEPERRSREQMMQDGWLLSDGKAIKPHAEWEELCATKINWQAYGRLLDELSALEHGQTSRPIRTHDAENMLRPHEGQNLLSTSDSETQRRRR